MEKADEVSHYKQSAFTQAIFRQTQTGAHRTVIPKDFNSNAAAVCLGVLCAGVSESSVESRLQSKGQKYVSTGEKIKGTPNSRSVLAAAREDLAVSANKWPGLKFVREGTKNEICHVHEVQLKPKTSPVHSR